MATVLDLCKALGEMRGLDESELKQVARALQHANLLPLANRQQRMKPPQITVKHCAVFLIGLACSSPSGSRTAGTLGPRVRKFMKLVFEFGSRERVYFLRLLIALLGREGDFPFFDNPNTVINRITFIVDDQHPEAEIDFTTRLDDGRLSTERFTFVQESYLDPARYKTDDAAPALFDRCAHAYIIGPEALFRVHDLLGLLEPGKDGA